MSEDVTPKFNPKNAAAAAAKVRLAPGKHAMVILNAEPWTKEGKCTAGCRLDLKKVEDPGDTESIIGPRFSKWLKFPLGECPFTEDGLWPTWDMRNLVDVLSGIFPENVSALPTWDKQSRTFYYRGEPVESEVEKAVKQEEAFAAAGAQSEIFNGDLSVAVGKVVYMDLRYDNDFAITGTWYPTLPEGWELTTDSTQRVEAGEQVKRRR